MKNLKNLWMVILTVMISITMVNCSASEDSPIAEMEEIQKNEVYPVQIGFNGELDITYENMSRGTTEEGDVYGVQIYSRPDSEAETYSENPVWTAFAYGVFDDESKMTVNLLKGYKYKFVATLVKDAKNKLNNAIENGKTGFWLPFWIGELNYLQNKFIYSSSVTMEGLAYGSSTLTDEVFNIPNVIRFYGEQEDYVPGNKKNETVKIKMKRASFGAKFIAKEKAETIGTKLEIMIQGAPVLELTAEENKKQITETFTFYEVKKAWETNGNYEETIPVTINWTRTDGTVIPLGTHNITFKRNATTVVNVKVVNDSSESGVGCTIDESELGEMPDADETTIEDGTVVETDIKTQGTNNGN